jgi:hypothetical protein
MIYSSHSWHSWHSWHSSISSTSNTDSSLFRRSHSFMTMVRTNCVADWLKRIISQVFGWVGNWMCFPTKACIFSASAFRRCARAISSSAMDSNKSIITSRLDGRCFSSGISGMLMTVHLHLRLMEPHCVLLHVVLVRSSLCQFQKDRELSSINCRNKLNKRWRAPTNDPCKTTLSNFVLLTMSRVEPYFSMRQHDDGNEC